MSLDAGSIVALLAAAFVGGIVSGVAGFAFSLVTAGVVTRLLPPPSATLILVAAPFLLQLFGLVQFRHELQWVRLWPFLVGGVLGIPVGVEILQRIDAQSFRVLIGCLLVGYSVVMLAIRRPVKINAGAPADGAVGFLGGVLGGVAGFAGALPTIWAGLRGWPKDEQRAVFQPFILLIQFLTLVCLGVQGAITMPAITSFLVCVPAMLAGLWLGWRLYGRVDERGFRRIVLWLLLLSGITLVI